MSWQMFRWTWRLEGPLFVGTAPAGALNRCRPYVPARALWGAVTAELARLESADDRGYKEVRKELRNNARFSYLYPAELVGQDWFAWLPEYREGDGLVWKREDWKRKNSDAELTDREFRRRLLWTRPATAIDPATDSALDGSLRETECVQPFWRPLRETECVQPLRGPDEAPRPVRLVGYVFLRNGEHLKGKPLKWIRALTTLFVPASPKGVTHFGDLKGICALTTLFVGGDTRYGLGRIELVSSEPATRLFGEDVDLDGEDPRVSTNRALAHVVTGDGAPMCGEQEALGGWDMTSEQKRYSVNRPVWTPGSRVVDGDGTPCFGIDKHGLWSLDMRSGSQALSNGAHAS